MIQPCTAALRVSPRPPNSRTTPGPSIFAISAHPARARLGTTGMRQTSVNRPGYGPSTLLEGWTVPSAAAEMPTVADALALDRFAAVGTSGGGPHLLFIAALASDRVARCRVTSCLAPAGIPEFFDGMDPRTTSRSGSSRWRARGHLRSRDGLSSCAGASSTNRPHRRTELRSQTRPRPVSGVSRSSRPWPHPSGGYDDDMAFMQPWGFEVSFVVVPHEIRYGPQPHCGSGSAEFIGRFCRQLLRASRTANARRGRLL